MDICIRGINSNVVKALETSAKKHDLSREEYLRQCLERIAYDDRALGSKYEQQLQKLFQCLEGQQKQLSLLKNPVADWKMDFLKRNPGQRNRKERLYEWGKDI